MSPGRRRLVPTAAAAYALDITEAGVRQLAYRGRLTRYGTAQRALYDLDEISALRQHVNPPAAQPSRWDQLNHQERSTDRP